MRIHEILFIGGLATVGCNGEDSKRPEGNGGSIVIDDRCASSQVPCLIINRHELENGGTVNDEGELQGKVVRRSVYRCDPESLAVAEGGPQTVLIQCHAIVELWEDIPEVRGSLNQRPDFEADLDLQVELDPTGPMRMSGVAAIDGASVEGIGYVGLWTINEALFGNEAIFGHSSDPPEDVTAWRGDVTFRLMPPAGMNIMPPEWPSE